MRGTVLSIKTLLISGIVGLQIVTVSAILLSSYLSSEKVLLGHARQLMENVSSETRRHAEEFLLPARRAGDLTQRLANHRVLRTDDFPGMARYFYELLRLNPSFSGIYFGAADGQFSFVQRDASLVPDGYFTKTVLLHDGVRRVEISRHDAAFNELERSLDPGDKYDPRARPWYRAALEKDRQIWTDPYIFYTSKIPGVSSANPVYGTDGKVIGAVGVDIGIAHLSSFLAQLKISEHALAFIVNHNGDVIGYPEIDRIKKPTEAQDGGLRFARIDDFDDPLARAAVHSLGLGLEGFTLDKAALTSFALDGQTYLATFSPVLPEQLPWTLGIYAPESDFLGAFQENQRTNILMALAITVVACIAGILLWRSVARPISALRAHAVRVGAGDFGELPEIRSRYSEIRDTVASFRRMVEGLRDRDRRNRELSDGLRESETQLHQAQKMEAVGKLTGGIAHDFNNLLGVIVGNLESLRDSGAANADGRALAENAIHAALRGGELTQRLLAFARQQPLESEVVDLNALVLGTTGLLWRSLGAAVTIQTEIAEDLWRARVDPAQMEVALLNLATNARDAMPGGGELTIETANVVFDEAYAAEQDVPPGRYAMVAVSDTGSGMAPEVMERAVQPFFTTKDVGKGTGLGLSMVYGFIKQSHGHVAIESRPGEGATVKLCFPAVLDAEPLQPAPPDPIEIPGGAGESVLVVEDDPDVRSMAVRAIADLGYRVLEAADGPAALRLLGEEDCQADLLFTDVVLPNQMDGAALAEQARRLRPGIKVLFTSGYNEVVVGSDGGLDEGVALIAKPYRQHDLARSLRAVLEGESA